MAVSETDRTPLAGCLARLFWMLGGIVVLIFLSYFILNHGSLSRLDAIYWLIVGSLVMVRFVDIRFLGGQTAEGQPATIRDFQRYMIGLVAGAFGVWLILHGLNYLK